MTTAGAQPGLPPAAGSIAAPAPSSGAVPAPASTGAPAAGPAARAAGRSTIALAFRSTGVERRLVDDWAAALAAGGGLVVADASDAATSALLADADPSTDVLPVRVAWLPPERGGDRRAALTDLLTLRDPRHPRPRSQARIVRRDPERWRVITGEHASIGDLRGRFGTQTAGGGDEAFAAFVRRQADLALARAERSVVGDRYKVARLVSEEILHSARFRSRLQELAGRLSRPETELSAEATGYLEEMVASHSHLAIDVWERLVRSVLRSYVIDADRERLRRLAELGRSHALVFLPNHRSYLDPLVLRTALHESGLPPNHVLGGVNVAFWPIGAIARGSGHVFIRRTVRDNPVYSATLREYIAYLVRKRFNLEWYIEGGRTRTGKMRPPRYGILAYLVEAFREGAVGDVLLVPVSIVYDELPEVGAMAAEGVGGRKQKESLGWMLRYIRTQRRTSSVVHLRFGEPLSLREAVTVASPQSAPPAAGRDRTVEKIAFEVAHRINRSTPITAPSLATLALLGNEDRALTLDEVWGDLQPIMEYVERRHLPVADTARLGDPPALQGTLEALRAQGVAMCFTDGAEPVWAIGAARHLEAAFYRNAVVHFFVDRAIVELIVVRAAEAAVADPVLDAWEEALRLRDLLKFEFFFASKAEFAEQLRTELDIFDPSWEQRTGPEEVWERLTASRLYVAHRVLRPYLDAYGVVADHLAAADPDRPVEKKAFLRECLGLARQYHLQGRLGSAESISTELFGTALLLAGNRGLLEPGGVGLLDRRRAFAGEVAAVTRRLRTIRHVAHDLPARPPHQEGALP